MEGSAALDHHVSEPPLPREHELRVLKFADLFGVFDSGGDIQGALHPVGPSTGADGLFLDDTRILSTYRMRIGAASLLTLSSTITRDNAMLVVDATSGPFIDREGREVGGSQIHIRRRRFLWDRRMYEAIVVRNYGDETVDTALIFEIAADFRDLFEIRGTSRRLRGSLATPVFTRNSMCVGYCGLDKRARETTVAFSQSIEPRADGCLSVPISIPSREHRTVMITVGPALESSDPMTEVEFARKFRKVKRVRERRRRRLRRITTSNDEFNAWIDRASADLSLLLTDLDTGPYPYAGIPWFSVPFGRDAVVTAWQLLWIEPSVARGVLQYLAKRQSRETSAFRDAQPGKIIHESRKGEMAALGEVPFESYYGGVDTTPLFIGLAAAYHRRTGDDSFAMEIWPAVEAALDWVDRFGDIDGDGFIEYQRGEESGLHNQGWKDSHDSVFHADGRLAVGPIALVEVQGYVCMAKRGAARLAATIGDFSAAERLRKEAAMLARRIDEVFWSDAIGGYGLALDGEKKLCEVRSSNAAHLLAAYVPPPERAAIVADTLCSPAFFSGWGIRTIAEGESRYNPMSYHNGTVWPHDCSIAAAGLSRYGITKGATRILSGMFDASLTYSDYRLPELFCGFRRRTNATPVAYPSACTPQAWASGSVFLMLQACLGLWIDAQRRIVVVTRPSLPQWLEQLVIEDLPVADAKATLRFTRTSGGGIEASLARSEGDVALLLRTS